MLQFESPIVSYYGIPIVDLSKVPWDTKDIKDIDTDNYESFHVFSRTEYGGLCTGLVLSIGKENHYVLKLFTETTKITPGLYIWTRSRSDYRRVPIGKYL